VSAIQTAIDAGLFVHVRVVSGVGFGGFLGEVIGYDGNKFVFNDPDAGVG
jgi:hypothetical protein